MKPTRLYEVFVGRPTATRAFDLLKSAERLGVSPFLARPLYDAYLRDKGAVRSPARPDQHPSNTTLRTRAESESAQATVDDLGLHHHPDPHKDWDHLLALAEVLTTTNERAAVLDAGGETYSPLVEWLYLYGYEDLHVLNTTFDRDFRRGPISYTEGDITEMPYADGRFAVVSSMSVVEHGVDAESFLKEAFRVLKLGGRLILSTDYWESGFDANEVTAYGVPWSPFSRTDMENLLDTARAVGFEVTSEPNRTVEERVVQWQDQGFIFICLSFVK